MSKSHTLKRKSFVTRDMTIQKGKISETLFFPSNTSGSMEKKRVTRKNIDWIAISRVTNVLALRNTFHSVYQLQGSAAAEHPTPAVLRRSGILVISQRRSMEILTCRAASRLRYSDNVYLFGAHSNSSLELAPV